MDKLCNELSLRVIRYLTDDETDFAARESLRNLRLVRREWIPLINPELFGTIAFWFSLESLENLDNIAKCTEL